ncbi:MAG TPA: hypothetical protein VGI57_08680 [Usitatibacter sp.]
MKRWIAMFVAIVAAFKIKLIDHGDGAEEMRKKFGPIYVKNRILANAYPGDDRDTTNIDVWNLLVVPASFLELANQSSGASPIAFHPGAVRYLKERGVTVR